MSTIPHFPFPEPDLSSVMPPDTAPPVAAATPSVLGRAILRTLIYADLFDYPLTCEEIAHYLMDCAATPAATARALHEDAYLVGHIDSRDGFYFLRGREAVVATRRKRAAASARLWPRAARYTRLLRHFPFVRMLAVTGALAMDNVAGNPDIDLLVISAPGRVWICRRLLILAVRGIRVFGDEICPNFILAADSLALPQQDLFIAHELAQMRPAGGHAVYAEMLAANGWLGRYLPNARPWPAPVARRDRPHPLQRLAERVLSARVLDGWERWELERLRRKLGADPTGQGEVACTPSQCKGHTGHYRRNVLRRFDERRAALGC
ncbi:MAG TPA: hypothetical protein VFM49_24250 [Chloroflexia bacterium]|nr:hypothetical protein [Chloroflexia bacterium]